MKQYVKVVGDCTRWYSDPEFTILHREDGPAVQWGRSVGVSEWYIDGQLHRINGPAIEDNRGYCAWYINGKYHTKTDFIRATAPHTVKDITLAEVEEILGYPVNLVK